MTPTIVDVAADVVRLPSSAEVAGVPVNFVTEFTHVRVRTDDGLVGYGAAYHADATTVAEVVRRQIAPMMIGRASMAPDGLQDELRFALLRRGRTGIALNAISAVDIALWDLIGKRLEEPLWRILGGRRDRVELYVTFDMLELDRDQAATVAAAFVADGFRSVKMIVGSTSARRGAPRSLGEASGAVRDGIDRVAVVREAVGPDVEIIVSAQNRFSLHEAQAFLDGVRDLDVGLFQEPIIGNHVRQMAVLRRHADTPLALGHNLEGPEQLNDYLRDGSIDYCQFNVVTGGGYSAGRRVVALCDVYGVPLMNGGSWVFHNMHLLAGASHVALGEWSHFRTALPAYAFYEGLPDLRDGGLDLSERPGLGFVPRDGALDEYGVG